jgi:Ca-activated chloride channel family protein
MSFSPAKSIMVAVLSLALVGGPAGRSWSWPWSNEQRKAERHLAAGRFDQALRHYENARLEQPDNPAIEYNIGNVLHKLEKFDEASAEYSKVIARSDSTLKEMAHYNMGNNYYVTGDLERAVESYSSALLEDPADHDAKYNLEMALRRQQQQQDKDQGKEGENQEKEKSEKEKEQEKEKQEEKSEKPDQEKRERKPKQGEMSEEEARRILNALNEQEKEERKDLLAGKSSRSAYVEKDW